MDLVTLLTKDNVYESLFILCQVNDSLKRILYYSHFAVSIIQLVIIFVINYMILRVLRRHLVITHNLFKWNFKICMGLCFVCIVLHAVYVFPTSKDRYGMLEITSKGEKNYYEFIDTIGDIFTIIFCLYFVCYLRFHVIYPNLDNVDSLFLSIFADLPDKYFPKDQNNDRVDDLRTTNEGARLLESSEYDEHFNRLLETSILSLNSSTDSNDPGLFDDRKEYRKWKKLARKMNTGLSRFSER